MSTGPTKQIDPNPIRTDGSNPFARHTTGIRVPDNIREIVRVNDTFAPLIRSALSALEESVRSDGPIPPPDFSGFDQRSWQSTFARLDGSTWLNAEWFAAETYLYRLVVDRSRYFETGLDPFARTKHEEAGGPAATKLVQTAFAGEGALVPGPRRGREAGSDSPRIRSLLAAALHGALWGNRVDLSYRVSAAHGHENTDASLLVVDEIDVAVDALCSRTGPVRIVTDNAGTELAGDLVLVDRILELLAAPVVLDLKFYPTYVSDATVNDVHDLINTFSTSRIRECTSLAARLRTAFDDGRLRLNPDPFWCEGEFLEKLPGRLETGFDRARAVIFKGDLNYRRAVYDTVWSPDIALRDCVPVRNTPYIFLRSLKSDVLSGVPADVIRVLDRTDSSWRNNGKRGIIQVAAPDPV